MHKKKCPDCGHQVGRLYHQVRRPEGGGPDKAPWLTFYRCLDCKWTGELPPLDGRMTVRLPSVLVEELDAAVTDGKFEDRSSVIRAALHELVG